MTLLIETPDTFAPQRDYVLDVILSEYLGLPWRRKAASRADVRITLQHHSGEVCLPDVLLSVTEDAWLAPRSMPKQPLSVWDTSDSFLEVSLVKPTLPIIYGEVKPCIRRDISKVHLPVDIFGSAFFMLTRYEEIVKQDRDDHDRFPAWASLAYQEGFLERPIIDEYVEILWAAIKSLWPGLQRKKREFQIKVSHDVDSPSRYLFGSTKRFVRTIAGDMIKRRDFASPLRAPLVRWGSREQIHPTDPANTFDWIMDVSENNGLTSAFYFICGRTDPLRDADYEPEHPAIRALMRRIHTRGHEIGLHPSYNTYRDPKAIRTEAERLRAICAEENIRQEEWGGRMHYLRWEQPTTLNAWNDAGMTYDSTLSYADRPGFRCGTCLEYPGFDAVNAKPLKVRIRPLVAMDCTVIADRYLGLGSTEAAFEKFEEVKQACRTVGGAFTLLWHNSFFSNSKDFDIYRRLVAEQ